MQLGTPRDALRPIVNVVLNLLMIVLPGSTMFAGYALGTALFPRNDTMQLVFAGAGVIPGGLAWLALGRALRRWSSPPNGPPPNPPSSPPRSPPTA